MIQYKELPYTGIQSLDSIKPNGPSRKELRPLLNLLKKSPEIAEIADIWIPYLVVWQITSQTSISQSIISQILKYFILNQCTQKLEIAVNNLLKNQLSISAWSFQKGIGYIKARPQWVDQISLLLSRTIIKQPWNDVKAQASKKMAVLVKKQWVSAIILSQVQKYLNNQLQKIMPLAKKDHVILVLMLKTSIDVYHHKLKDLQKITQSIFIEDSSVLLTLHRIRAVINFIPQIIWYKDWDILKYSFERVVDGLTTQIRFNGVQVCVTILKSIKQNKKAISQQLSRQCISLLIKGLSISVKSVASLLEQAIKIILQLLTPDLSKQIAKQIMKESLNYNDNRKKIFVLICVQSFLTVEQILNYQQDFFIWLINCCGQYKVTNAGALIQTIFFRLFQSDQKPQTWLHYWIQQYHQVLDHCTQQVLKGILDVVHPAIFKICPTALKSLTSEFCPTQNRWLAKLTLLSGCRQKNLLIIKDEGYYIESRLVLKKQQLQQSLLSADRRIVVRAFRFVLSSTKIKQALFEFQYNLLTNCIIWQSRTSYQDFRKDLLNLLSKLFQRTRIFIDSLKKKQIHKPCQLMIKGLMNHCYNQLYPSAPFQLQSFSVQIIQLLHYFFGHRSYQLRKDKTFCPVNYLQQITPNCFSLSHRNLLIQLMQSDYQSVRSMCNNILLYFELDVQQLQTLGMQIISSPNIKQFQAGARILSLAYSIQKQDGKILFIKRIQQLILNRIKKFQNAMYKQQNPGQQCLSHGLITALSFCISYCDKKVIDLKLQQIVRMMITILDLGTKISNQNVSISVFDKKQSQESSFKKGVQQIFKSNSLLTSLDDHQQDSQNLFVVSFYLLTKQSGYFFQSLGNVLQKGFQLPLQLLLLVTQSIYVSLTRIKHLGSICKLIQALKKILKNSKLLQGMQQKLSIRLIQQIQEKSYPSFVRRSAGLPFLFSALIKLLSQKKPIHFYIKQLFTMAKSTHKPISVHALNILKRVMQDSTLKKDLQQQVEQAVQIAIKGFSIEDWAIRNSSLMLFNSLLTRILGDKSKVSVSDFFQHYPKLKQFFLNQLENFNNGACNLLYPTIYPINLLLSLLKPPQFSYKGTYSFQSYIQKLKVCSGTTNYLGRKMAARAICAFAYKKGAQFMKQLLRQIKDLSWIKKQHNKAHGILLILVQLMRYSQKVKIEDEIKKQMEQKIFILESECYPICVTYIKIYKQILKINKKEQIRLKQILRIKLQKLRQYKGFDYGINLYYKKAYKLLLLLLNHHQLQQQLNQLLSHSVKNNYHCHQSTLLFIISKKISALQISLKPSTLRLIANILVSSFQPSYIYTYISLTKLISQNLLQPTLQNQLFTYLITQFNTNQVLLSSAILSFLSKIINPSDKQLYNKIILQCTYPQIHIQLRSQALDAILRMQKVIGNTQLQIAIHNLLTDQIPWIRDAIGYLIAKNLKCKHQCSQKMVLIFLKYTKDQTLLKLLQIGESVVRKKNHTQKRIFFYDKANRSRSDIIVWLSVIKELTLRQIKIPQFEIQKQQIRDHCTSILKRDEYTLQCCFKANIKGETLQPILNFN